MTSEPRKNLPKSDTAASAGGDPQGAEPRLIRCPKCSHQIPVHHLWCEHCEAPNPFSPAVAVERSDATPVQREKLYSDLLADLNRLEQIPTADRDRCRLIREFYQGQLEDVRRLQRRQQSEKARCILVAQVKAFAHAGEFERAIKRIEREAAVSADDPVLVELRGELSIRHRKQQAASALAAEVQGLLEQADSDLKRQLYQSAIEKLEQANKLQPDNERIKATLGRTRGLLADEQLRQHQAEKAEAAAEAKQVAVETSLAKAPLAEPDDALASASQSDQSRPLKKASAVTQGTTKSAKLRTSFEDQRDVPTVTQRQIEAFSKWTSLVKPFLLDNVGWFVGAFLVIAGFVVLIVTFWNTIEQNQILVHSLVFACMFLATGMFFALAYFMRLKYPQLESSSDVLLVIVALMIPLVFAAAMLTALIPASEVVNATAQLARFR